MAGYYESTDEPLDDHNSGFCVDLSDDTRVSVWDDEPQVSTRNPDMAPPRNILSETTAGDRDQLKRRLWVGGSIVATAGIMFAGIQSSGGIEGSENLAFDVTSGSVNEPASAEIPANPTLIVESSLVPAEAPVDAPAITEAVNSTEPTTTAEIVIVPVTTDLPSTTAMPAEAAPTTTQLEPAETTLAVTPTTEIAIVSTTLAPSTTLAAASETVPVTTIIPTTIPQRLVTIAGVTVNCDAPTITIQEGMYISRIEEKCDEDLDESNNFCDPSNVPLGQEISLQPENVLDIPCANTSDDAVSTQSGNAVAQPEIVQANLSSGNSQYDIWLRDFCATAGGTIVEATTQRNALENLGITDTDTQDHILFNTDFLTHFSLEVVGSKPECVPDSWEDIEPYLP